MALTIFEGPDGAGKTTLIKAVARRSRKTVHEMNHGPYLGETDIWRYYSESIALTLPPLDSCVLMDRSWISESIYGPIARGVNRITVLQRRMLERLALTASGVVVVCLPPYDECRKAYMSRRHLEYLDSENKLRDVYLAFSRLIDDERMATTIDYGPRVGIPLFVYDWTREIHRGTFIEVLEQQRPPRNEGPGVGRFAPGVTLMVGDQTSANLPSIDFDPGSFQAKLVSHLDALHVPESDFYWIDALTARGRETSTAYWLDKLQPKKIVAINAIAAAWCRKYVGNDFCDMSNIDEGVVRLELCQK